MAVQAYTPAQRARNQRNIVLAAAAFLAVSILSGLAQSWPARSYVAIFIVVGIVTVIVWRLFAGPRAMQYKGTGDDARWPYLSKRTWDKIRQK